MSPTEIKKNTTVAGTLARDKALESFSRHAECLAAGRRLRDSVPRTSHARWSERSHHRDPIDLLKLSNRDRVSDLVPIRYGRMLRSPLTFLRGAAALMASDLAHTPMTGPRVQACGDCHLLNFGLFATPERNLIFDINDFDETLPAPWEWDLKRLAVSFAVASRDNGHSERQAESAAVGCVQAYRTHLRGYSKQSPLQVWYARLDEHTFIEAAPDLEARRTRRAIARKARRHVGEYLFPRIATQGMNQFRLVDQPPLIFHPAERDWDKRIRAALDAYRTSLPDERRVLFERYKLQDVAFKVVGIGSVGTRCYVALFCSADRQPLLLQFKEARASVLERYAGKSRYDNHGQRVVIGQRLMQSASDIFLGWARGVRGVDVFGRQLRDMKMSAPIAAISPRQLCNYAGLCGWTLARAHAKSGNAALISGYLGTGNTFDRAMGKFALAYADQNERDYAALVAAVKKGRIQALVDEPQ